MDQRGKGGGGLWSLKEDRLRVVAVLGRSLWNHTNIAWFHNRLLSGLERSEGVTIDNLRVRCQPLPSLSMGPHQRRSSDCIPLSPPAPLPLFTIPWFVFDWGSTGQFYHPQPPPCELYPWRCLWGGWQDVRPTRRSKSPPCVNVPLLTVTFSTGTGLTSHTHASPGLQ